MEFFRHDADTIMEGRVSTWTHEGDSVGTVKANVDGVQAVGKFTMRDEQEFKAFCAALLKGWIQFTHLSESVDQRVELLGEPELDQRVEEAGLLESDGPCEDDGD